MDADGSFQIAAVERKVLLFVDSPEIPVLARLRTQRQASQCAKEMDMAVRQAIADVLSRYPEVTR